MPRFPHRSVSKSWVRSLEGVALTCLLTAAAYPQSAITPAPGDTEVFYRYLARAHGEASAVANATSTVEAAAARLRAQPADLPALDSVYQNVTNAIASLDSEARSYIDGLVNIGQKPDPVKLQAYYGRRTQILHKANEQLHRAVGDARWSQLQAFIDGEFRSHIKDSSEEFVGQDWLRQVGK